MAKQETQAEKLARLSGMSVEEAQETADRILEKIFFREGKEEITATFRTLKGANPEETARNVKDAATAGSGFTTRENRALMLLAALKAQNEGTTLQNVLARCVETALTEPPPSSPESLTQKD